MNSVKKNKFNHNLHNGIHLRRNYYIMDKKKAIKLVTATAIAASAVTAVAPAQSEAASSLTKTISKARATMKKPYDRYVKSTTKLAGVNSVKADIAKAKKAQKDANTAIKKSKLSKAEKNKKYAQIKAYVKYITHAENYVKGYEEGQGKRNQLNALSAELNKAVAAKDITAIEKQIAELDATIKQVKKYIKDTVYGAKAEGLLYERFTKPSEAALKRAKAALAELQVPVVNTEALDSAIADFEIVKEEEYTAESYAAYKVAVDAAKEVKVNENATQEEVDAATKAATDAKTALEKKVSNSVTITTASGLAANDLALMLGAVEYKVEGTVSNSANVEKVEVTFSTDGDSSDAVPATLTGDSYKVTVEATELFGNYSKATVKVTYKDGSTKQAEQSFTVSTK